jgi:uncharacterized protein YbcI
VHERLSEPRTLAEDGDTMAAVSRRIVRLYKEHYGKGPTRARAYHWRDLVVVLLRDGFTPLEKTLQGHGQGDAVRELRGELGKVMGAEFKRVVEEELRREVIALMSSSHVDPDFHVEVFVLAPDCEAAESVEPSEDAGAIVAAELRELQRGAPRGAVDGAAGISPDAGA